MKYSNDTIGNRTRDLLACSSASQPNALPRPPTPILISVTYFVLPVPRLSCAVNRYLPGCDLDLLGLKKCHGKWEGFAQCHVYSERKSG